MLDYRNWAKVTIYTLIWFKLFCQKGIDVFYRIKYVNYLLKISIFNVNCVKKMKFNQYIR